MLQGRRQTHRSRPPGSWRRPRQLRALGGRVVAVPAEFSVRIGEGSFITEQAPYRSFEPRSLLSVAHAHVSNNFAHAAYYLQWGGVPLGTGRGQGRRGSARALGRNVRSIMFSSWPHPERLGQNWRIAEKRRRPAQISLTGHQDERNASLQQFVDRRMDTRLAQLNVQQRAVDVVRAYCLQHPVEVSDRPYDRAFEEDQDLVDKLRDEQFVLGDEHPQAATGGLSRFRSC